MKNFFLKLFGFKSVSDAEVREIIAQIDKSLINNKGLSNKDYA